MKLIPDRRVTLLLVLIFVGSLSLIGILFASNVERVYASSCGTDYRANYTCEHSYDWIGSNSIKCPHTHYEMRKTIHHVYLYDNPLTHRLTNSWQAFLCAPCAHNCPPSYCN